MSAPVLQIPNPPIDPNANANPNPNPNPQAMVQRLANGLVAGGGVVCVMRGVLCFCVVDEWVAAYAEYCSWRLSLLRPG